MKEIKKNIKESLHLRYGLYTGVILNIILLIIAVIFKKSNYPLSRIIIAPYIISLLLFLGVSISTVINYFYKNVRKRYRENFFIKYVSFLFILAAALSFYLEGHIFDKDVYLLTFMIGSGILVVYNHLKIYIDNTYKD